MPANTCPSCEHRRGRRACPALGKAICSHCCGTKRLTIINCPPDCGYLASARTHPPAIIQRRQRREARLLIPLIRDLSPRQHQLFFFLQSLIDQYRPTALPPLYDVDVADAVAALAKTLETERKGIIYHHKAKSLPAQRLESELKVALDKQRDDAKVPIDKDIVIALRRTEQAARQAKEALAGTDTDYLELIQRVVQDLAAKSKPGVQESGQDSSGEPSRLIIPGS